MGIEPISLHSRWIVSPPFRRIAPATPPPNCRSLLAAFTMASVSISVRSPCWMMMRLANFMAHPPADFRAKGNCLVGSFERANNFQRFHFWRWIEEVHSDAVLGAKCNRGYFRYGKRRRGAREDCTGFSKFVEYREYFELRLHFIRNSLDN